MSEPRPLPAWGCWVAAGERCPDCGRDDWLETTTVGYLVPPDRNRAFCHVCGWKGTVDEAATRYDLHGSARRP